MKSRAWDKKELNEHWVMAFKKEIKRRKKITLWVWLHVCKRSWKRKFYQHCHKLSAFLIILLVGLSFDWRPLTNDAFQEVSFYCSMHFQQSDTHISLAYFYFYLQHVICEEWHLFHAVCDRLTSFRYYLKFNGFFRFEI